MWCTGENGGMPACCSTLVAEQKQQQVDLLSLPVVAEADARLHATNKLHNLPPQVHSNFSTVMKTTGAKAGNCMEEDGLNRPCLHSTVCTALCCPTYTILLTRRVRGPAHKKRGCNEDTCLAAKRTTLTTTHTCRPTAANHFWDASAVCSCPFCPAN
jgi:hypothetical protein